MRTVFIDRQPVRTFRSADGISKIPWANILIRSTLRPAEIAHLVSLRLTAEVDAEDHMVFVIDVTGVGQRDRPADFEVPACCENTDYMHTRTVQQQRQSVVAALLSRNDQEQWRQQQRHQADSVVHPEAAPPPPAAQQQRQISLYLRKQIHHHRRWCI